MKRVSIIAVALVALVAGAPAAHADHTSYRGGCFYVAAEDSVPVARWRSPRYRWTGVLIAAAYPTDWAGAPMPLSSIAVSCSVRFYDWDKGEEQYLPFETHASGIGVAANATPGVIETDAENFSIEVCEQAWVDGEAYPWWGPMCYTKSIIAQDDHPLVVREDPSLSELMFPTAAAFCPIVAGFSPGMPPALTIAPDGDIIANGSPVLDCPPWGPLD